MSEKETVSVLFRRNTQMLDALAAVEGNLSPEQVAADLAMIYAAVMHQVSDDPETDAATILSVAFTHVGPPDAEA